MEIQINLLQQHSLRNTPARAAILHMFEENKALSESDIEKGISIPCDRVTIYRTLSTFLDKGILHKVLDDAGVTKYALCSSGCQEGAHNHNHVHFKCNTCHETVCIDKVSLPSLTLPNGFQAEETNVLVQGTCDKCSG